jgi:hypothetical protein
MAVRRGRSLAVLRGGARLRGGDQAPHLLKELQDVVQIVPAGLPQGVHRGVCIEPHLDQHRLLRLHVHLPRLCRRHSLSARFVCYLSQRIMTTYISARVVRTGSAQVFG